MASWKDDYVLGEANRASAHLDALNLSSLNHQIDQTDTMKAQVASFGGRFTADE